MIGADRARPWCQIVKHLSVNLKRAKHEMLISLTYSNCSGDISIQ